MKINVDSIMENNTSPNNQIIEFIATFIDSEPRGRDTRLYVYDLVRFKPAIKILQYFKGERKISSKLVKIPAFLLDKHLPDFLNTYKPGELFRFKGFWGKINNYSKKLYFQIRELQPVIFGQEWVCVGGRFIKRKVTNDSDYIFTFKCPNCLASWNFFWHDDNLHHYAGNKKCKECQNDFPFKVDWSLEYHEIMES